MARYSLSFAADGRTAGLMAVRVLNGEKPQDIPIAESTNVYMFDWRALQRWGLKESRLPPGSVVLNRQPTVWELYWRYIVGSIVLLLFQTLLIFGLVRQRERRRKTETELNLSNDRLRRAVEAGKCVGWDWDAKTGCDRWFGDLQTMFGIQSDTYSGPKEDFYRRVHPEDRAFVRKAVADARQNREPFVAEFRVLRLDRAVRWINARGQFYYAANGDAVRMLGMAVDITERKQAEQVLREGEERFRVVANTAPVMIWMSGTDKLCNYFNQPWLEFTGRPIELELGNGWAEGVHPEDLERTWDTYTKAFAGRESFKVEYRLRRHDGEYRWVSDMGVPRMNADGSFAGYIGSCTDITESKLAEDTLASVGRRLIEAHEEERTWIARELHDDINQRIALLAIELKVIETDPGALIGTPKREVRMPAHLSEGEMGALLAAPAVDGPLGRRDRAILELFYASGLRLSELVGLDLDDVNVSARMVRVLGKGGRQRLVPFNTSTGTLVYTPNTGFQGTDSFQFTVTNSAASLPLTNTISAAPAQYFRVREP
jgi:PAS domain S-box-containing protein